MIAASVWMALNSGLRPPPASAGTSTVRFNALTMPVVTVPDKPSGEPMATTGSPTTRSRDWPSTAGSSGWSLSMRNTARSVIGSRPTMRAGTPRPSVPSNVTAMSPPSAAGATTWLLVRM